jgi:hypothetical protein
MLRKKPKTSQNPILLRYCRKMTVTSIPIEIFRRISAQITASCGQNIVHAVLSVETSPTTRKTQKRNPSTILSKMTVISVLIKIFRRLHAQITASYGQNIVHSVVCFEKSPKPRKTLSFYDIVEK